MPSKVEMIERKDVFEQGIFRIEEMKLRHELHGGGMSEPITRLSLERGISAAAVVHRTDTDELVFTEQFRASTYDNGPGWLLEVPAGMVDGDELPIEAIRRELVEEIGYDAPELRPVSVFYVSPGGTSEQIHLFYAPVTAANQQSAGGGVAHEHEDIRVRAIPREDVRRMLMNGELSDAKTIIGVQWLLLNA